MSGGVSGSSCASSLFELRQSLFPFPALKDLSRCSFEPGQEQEQLSDICDMLEDLSALLEREISEDEHLRSS